MFKQFNNQFYRSLDFYMAICLILYSLGAILDNEYNWWIYLQPILIPFTLYQSFFSKKGNLKKDWLIYLCVGIVFLGFWLEFIV
ncbi:TPA: hypothetical protein ACHVGK_000574 [Streptococcus suis]